MADSDEESFHSASEGLEEEDFDTIKDEKNIPKVETSKAKYSEEKESVGVDENETILKPSDNTKVEAKQENQPTKQIDQNEIREKPNIEDDVPINKKEEKIPSNEGWDTFEDEDQKSSSEVTGNDWDDDWKTEFEPTTSVDTIEKEKARQDLPKEKARQELPKEKKSITTDDDWFAKQLAESSKSPPKQSSIWDWSGFNDVVTAVGEGFSTVVENSFGLPNPEEMARISVAERRKLLEEAQNIKEPEPSLSSDESIPSPDYTRSNSNVPLNSLGGLFSGLVNGSLDVLETLGKKTFETLTVKDDAEKRRFIFQPGKQENLSEVLRELRTNDDGTNSPAAKHTSLGYGSTVMEKFNTNFVSLFEKSGGMVHLEGLELLSSGKEKELSGFANSREFDNLLSNFCLEDVSECSSEDFEFEFRKSIRGIGLPYKAENVISVNQDLTQELLSRQATVDAGEEIVVDAIHEAAICALAKLTAHAIQALHKFAQLILIEQPNMPFIFAFTYLICRRLSFYASQYANILSLTNSSDNMNWVNNLKTIATTVKSANEIYQEINTRIQSTNILASSSNSNKCNNEIKIEKIQLTNFDRVDLQAGFSVYKARNSPICYHVVLVEGGLSVYRAPDQNAAEIIRDKLNRIRGVATEAVRNQMLERLLQLYYEHPKWEEVHYASYLGLPSYLDFLCSTRDPLMVVNTTNIEDGRFPIHLAAEKNLLSTVKKLLGYGADFTKCDLDGRNVIHYAAKDSVSILTELSKRPDFNTALNKQDDHGLLPLHYACEAGNVETVFILLKHSEGSLTSGGSVRNIIEFMSSLTQPLSSGQQKCLELVLKRDPNVIFTKNDSVLHQKLDKFMLKTILKAIPLAVDFQDSDSKTPLHVAAKQNDLASAIQLLAYGAQIDLQDSQGNTALHFAVAANASNIVRLLLCFGFSPVITNTSGKAPKDLKTTVEIAKLFKDIGSNSGAEEKLHPIVQASQNAALAFQANKSPEEKKKSARLLSLDGGGIRGLCLIQMLLHIEQELGENGAVLKHFDWIAGTSTGAILALLLATQTPLTDCLRLYLRFKDDVFVGSRPYDSSILEAFLKERFGESTTMAEIKNVKVMVTATNGNCHPLELLLFRNYVLPGNPNLPKEKYTDPQKVPIWKAARCSSAAPTYFPSFENQIMDGGLIANNPVCDLLTDVQLYNSALMLQNKSPLDVSCVVSIGTGRIPPRKIETVDLAMPSNLELSLNAILNVKKAVEAIWNLKNMLIEQVACSDGQVVERATSWAHSLRAPFFRFTPQLLSEIALDAKEDEVVVQLMWTTKVYMAANANQKAKSLAEFLKLFPA